MPPSPSLPLLFLSLPLLFLSLPLSSSLFLARSSSTGLLGAYNEWRRHTTSKLDAEPDAYSGSDGVTLLMGRRNMHLDAEKRIIHFADGTSVT